MDRPTFKVHRAQSSAALTVASAELLIKAERRRQISVEGWSANHDDEHDDGEIAAAADCYAAGAAAEMEERLQQEDISIRGECPIWGDVKYIVPKKWPKNWSCRWWKPKTLVSNLIRSGALYLAEKDRLVRAGLPHDHIDVAIEGVIIELEREISGPEDAP